VSGFLTMEPNLRCKSRREALYYYDDPKADIRWDTQGGGDTWLWVSRSSTQGRMGWKEGLPCCLPASRLSAIRYSKLEHSRECHRRTRRPRLSSCREPTCSGYVSCNDLRCTRGVNRALSISVGDYHTELLAGILKPSMLHVARVAASRPTT